jgi:transposase-like protein
MSTRRRHSAETKLKVVRETLETETQLLLREGMILHPVW